MGADPTTAKSIPNTPLRMPFSRFFSLMPATIEMANTAREKYSKEVNLRATDANRGKSK